MIFEIPTASDPPSYRQRTEIDGSIYVFAIEWNGRADAWFLSIADDEETPLVSGLKIVSDLDLLFSTQHIVDLPVGYLIAVDLTLEGQEAGRDDLGTRVQFRYYTPDEFA